ncbi:hypothetical protein [Alkalicoccus luteus]|uniref:Uncharacterized protein n=1 Tax=Alkalicoccus luteus TaxID=1237094 RepID=A0A969Q0Q2_9BACI|nr:hypothetical protein [Alkalicoccus luteus]NJP38987.1 hypothetical protein [Alkalicoccus luteus]
MDMLLRDINPAIVKAIDEKAKKSNLSRQVYLKEMIENHVMLKDFNDREAELKSALDRNTEVIHLVYDQMQKNNQLIHELTEDDGDVL